MKVVGYTALRYGKDYLAYAIRSIIDHIDEYHILYATIPSHGHYSDLPCPDSEEELYAIAQQAAGSKLYWHRGNWRMEGEQRNSIYEYAPDADIVVNLDYDEIWQDGLINYALDTAINNDVRYWRVPMRHYWRSFYKCILRDPAYPARIIKPKATDVIKTLSTTWAINHLGYAIRPEVMKYKWQIHGHLSELRHDVNWYQDVFLANRLYDCHPVGSEFWQPEDINPFNYLPYWMVEHPYYGKEIIE